MSRAGIPALQGGEDVNHDEAIVVHSAIALFGEALTRLAIAGGPNSPLSAFRKRLESTARLGRLEIFPERGADTMFRYPPITPAEERIVRAALDLLYGNLGVLASLGAPISAEQDRITQVRGKIHPEPAPLGGSQ